MSDRRMINKNIISDNRFGKLKIETKYLYIMLILNADDEGVVPDPVNIAKTYRIPQKNIKILEELRYILTFPSGVCVIKHWYCHNKIRKDRKKDSTYIEELSQLIIDDRDFYTEKNKGFKHSNDNQLTTKCQPNDNQLTTKCQPNDNQLTTNKKVTGCIGKYRLGKDSIKKVSKKEVEATSYNKIIKTYFEDEKIQNALIEFIKMRKVIKKPLTNYALKSICEKLIKEFKPEEQEQVIQQSVINNWQGIYPIKKSEKQETTTTNKATKLNKHQTLSREEYNKQFLEMMKNEKI